MNEAEWLASEDPGAMLEYVGRGCDPTGLTAPVVRVSDRKLRLFACACARLVWHLLTDPRSREAVLVAERYADGLASDGERSAACANAGGNEPVPFVPGTPPDPARAAVWACGSNASDYTARAAAGYSGLPPAACAALLRDVGGSPFRPVTPAAMSTAEALHWYDCLTPAVLALARAAYSEGREVPCGRCGRCGGERTRRVKKRFGSLIEGVRVDFKEPCPDCRGSGRTSDGLLDPDRLLILADALEEAGCDNEDVLRHLRGQERCPSCLWLGEPPRRGPYQAGVHCSRCHGVRRIPLRGPHCRGCWTVDLILNKS